MVYKNCYIISSSRQKISGIIDLLRNKNIKVILPLLDFGIDFIESIENAIKKSDFICCILNKDTDKSQLFELGVARGLQKPIFIIAEDDTLLSSLINSFVYVKSNVNDLQAISYNLEHFLNNTKKKRTTGESKKLKSIDNHNNLNPSNVISKIYEPNISEREIQSILEELFSQQKDITVVSQNDNFDKGADLAIWIDEVELVLGGPILIELKTRANPSKDFFNMAMRQMQNYLSATNSPVGIIVFKNSEYEYQEPKNNSMPLIVFMEIKTFVQYIIDKKLAKFLIDKRNEAAHRGDSNG